MCRRVSGVCHRQHQSRPHTKTASTALVSESTFTMAIDDPTNLMTAPDEITNQTTGSTMTPSSSRGAGFYFQCAVVVIGVVGTAANGLVLYALVASKVHKKHMLIVNQNLLDFFGCLFLSIMNAARLSNMYLEGMRGHWLCLTVLSEGPGWGPMLASMINLAAITTELNIYSI